MSEVATDAELLALRERVRLLEEALRKAFDAMAWCPLCDGHEHRPTCLLFVETRALGEEGG